MTNAIRGFKTVSTTMHSWHDSKYKYEVGKTHEVANAPRDGKACGPGIHFCVRKADCLQYTNNKTDYIMLEVEANAEDLLGMDATKTRASKIKVLKIHETVTKFGPEFKAAAKKITEMKLNSGFLVPKKTTTLKKVTELAKIAMKVHGVSNVKIIDNLFELRYFVCDGDKHYASYESLVSGDYEDFSAHTNPAFKNLAFGKSGAIPTADVANEFVSLYLQSIIDKEPAAIVKAHKAAIDLIALGCLPLGQSQKSFLVFMPKENHFKTKLTHV